MVRELAVIPFRTLRFELVPCDEFQRFAEQCQPQPILQPELVLQL